MLDVLDEIIEEQFKDKKTEYPYKEWEQKRALVKERLKNMKHYVEEAANSITIMEGPGRPSKLNLVQKTMLFLFARMMNKSNRDMEFMMLFLEPLVGDEVSYKTVERLYADEEVMMVLHNFFVLLLKENKPSGDFAGDGTGYTLTVTQHYRSDVKKNSKKYRYVFRLIDIQNGLYVCFGYSEISEMDAFNKAIFMLRKIGIKINTNRLDRYYSSGKVIRMFGRKVSLYLIPKKNMRGVGLDWYRTIKEMFIDPVGYLQQYFKRNLTETGISSDKRRFGWTIRQRLEDRRENALFALTLLHNLFFIRIRPS